MKTKEVGWAYPTSTAATRYGFKSTGCWVVKTTIGHDKPVYHSGHADPDGALHAASLIDAAWCPMFIRFMPDALVPLFACLVLDPYFSLLDRLTKTTRKERHRAAHTGTPASYTASQAPLVAEMECIESIFDQGPHRNHLFPTYHKAWLAAHHPQAV